MSQPGLLLLRGELGRPAFSILSSRSWCPRTRGPASLCHGKCILCLLWACLFFSKQPSLSPSLLSFSKQTISVCAPKTHASYSREGLRRVLRESDSRPLNIHGSPTLSSCLAVRWGLVTSSEQVMTFWLSTEKQSSFFTHSLLRIPGRRIQRPHVMDLAFPMW